MNTTESICTVKDIVTYYRIQQNVSRFYIHVIHLFYTKENKIKNFTEGYKSYNRIIYLKIPDIKWSEMYSIIYFLLFVVDKDPPGCIKIHSLILWQAIPDLFGKKIIQ